MRKRWGWFITLLRGKHFKVKILYFKEGGSISMQRHMSRSELWLFIFGEGEFHKNNASTSGKWSGFYKTVEPKTWHQFKARKPSLVLEIQYGQKCSERDIVRV